MSLQDWTDEQARDHPQFFFWNMTMFELLLLDYVRSLRAGDFDLYICQGTPKTCSTDIFP